MRCLFDYKVFVFYICAFVLRDVKATKVISNLNWICEDSAPCVRAVHPHGGVAEVAAATERYSLLISVHRRQTAEEEVMDGWVNSNGEPTWNVDVRWFRLLETRMRVALPTCRNKLSCDVRLLDANDLETEEAADHVYSHFLVEVRFDGHPSTTKMQLVIRKNLNAFNNDLHSNGNKHDDFDSLLTANEANGQAKANGAADRNINSGVYVDNDGVFKPLHLPNAENTKVSDAVHNPEVRNHPQYGVLFPSNEEKDEKNAGEEKFNTQSDQHQDYTNIIEWKGPRHGSNNTDTGEDGQEFDDNYDSWSWDNPDYQKVNDPDSSSASNSTVWNQITTFLTKPAGIVIIILVNSASLAALGTCCYVRRKRKRREKAERPGPSVKIGRKSPRKRRFFWRLFRSKPYNYQPVPSQGIFNKKEKNGYSTLPSDSEDDDYNATVRDRSFEELKNTSKEMSDRASKAFVSAKRRGSVLSEKVARFATKTLSCFTQLLLFLRKCFLACFLKCCAGRQNTSSTSDSSDESGPEGGSSPLKVVPPSSGGGNSFSPTTDISGRFPTSSYENNPTNSKNDEYLENRSEHNTYHTPHPRCGLHCVQNNNTNIIKSETSPCNPKSSDESSVASGDCRPATSSTSVTSFSSGVSSSKQTIPPTQKNMSVGDASTNQSRPQLPSMITRTKEGFRRENQRMTALLRKWEKRSSSCVTIDETNNKSHGDVTSRRSSSVSGRFLSIDNHDRSSRYPPKLAHRRKRLSRGSCFRNEASDENRKSPAHEAVNRKTTSRSRSQRRNSPSTSQDQNQNSCVQSSQNQCATTNNGHISLKCETQTGAIDTQSKSDTFKKNSVKNGSKPIFTNVNQKSNGQTDPDEAIKRTKHLQSVANAFLTSDDEYLYSADEGYEQFWQRDNT
ncbi:uncharacterized protein LOC100178676 [Ciona intestinalis]